MKKLIYIFTMLAVLFLGTACDSYLDRQPDDQLTSENIFEKRTTTFQYLVNVYSWVPDVTQLRGYNGAFYNNCSDLVSLAFTANFYMQYVHNNFSPSTSGLDGIWQNMYYGIREATYFMQNVDRCPELTDAEIKKYTAEARFMRAFYYTELLRLFGPVFMFGDEMADFNDPDLVNYDRTPWDKCVEWVCNEYDLAAADLPDDPFVNQGEYGRATKGAALGMKARLLVYNARPLFNGQNNTGIYNNVKNRFGEKLFSTEYDESKWQRAADACKAVIDYGYYELIDTDNPLEDIHEVFVAMDSRENVFAKIDGNAYDTRISSRPAGTGFGGNAYGSLAPTMKLVDAFAMANGKYPVKNIDSPDYKNGMNPEFDATSGYTEEGSTDFAHPFFLEFTSGVEDKLAALPTMNMFVNREPRFYANVFWSGSTWVENGVNVKTDIQFYRGGNSSDANNYPPTGIMSLKWVKPSDGGGNFTSVCWPILRYADILLMYAECLNEINPDHADILTYWNQVRDRAGVLNIEDVYGNVAGNQELQRKYLRQERMVELCVEGVRFFDARTWMTAEYDYNGEVVGCNIMAKNDDINGDFWKRTSIFDCLGEAGLTNRRSFTKKNYLLPIPQTEMRLVPGMTQNLGWE